MQLISRPWLTRLAAGVCVGAALITTPVFAQTTIVDPTKELTEDVVTRILGLEKADLDEASGDEAKLKIRKLIAEGIVLFREGKGDDALKKFESARDADSSLPPADVLLARLCFAVNDQNFVRLGLNVLNRAADKEPNAPEPYLMLGQLALLEGRLTDAYVLFEKANLELDGKATKWSEDKLKTYKKNVYAGRVSVCEQRQNWKQGETEVDHWLALDPQDPVALFRKGRLLFMQADKDDKKIAEARKLLEDAYANAVSNRKDPEQLPVVPPVELALLELQTANGSVEKARKEITLIDSKESEWKANKKEGSRVFSTVSQWYLGQGNFNQAKNYAIKASEMDPKSPALRQLTAVIDYYNNHNKEAEDEFSAMNQEQPDDFFAANFLALVLADAKLPDGANDDTKRLKAVRIAEMNARLNPKSPVALATLGWAYYNAGRNIEAAKLFGALEQEQNVQVSPDTAYYMAKTFASLPSDQFPNALGRAKSLLELAVKSTGVFRYKQEARSWLVNLGGKLPPEDNTDSSTTPTVPVSRTTPKNNDTPPTTTPEPKKPENP